MATDFEDILSISKFSGINQCSDGHNTNIQYAVSGKNFDTSYGGFKPYRKASLINSGSGTIDTSIAVSDGGDGALTLAFLTKRWQYNGSSIGKSDSYENLYAVMVCDGKLYYRKKHLNTFVGQSWTEIKDDNNESFAFNSSKFDYVPYEINYYPPVEITPTIIAAVYAGSEDWYVFGGMDDFKYYEVKSDDGISAYYTNDEGTNITIQNGTNVRQQSADAPIDCLFMCNSKDGTYCVYAPIASSALKCVKVYTRPANDSSDIKFGCIARHDDRLFGGNIDTDPDKLMYCAYQDPFNWEQDNKDPANGAGDIQQPMWDGDSIIAIKEFGSSLLVIRKQSIWRITGTNPSEYSYKKQYGEGTIAEDTFAVNGAYAYMLTDDDIKTYDGNSTYHTKYGYVKDVLDMAVVNNDRLIGRMLQDKYVLQVCASGGDKFVVYNTAEGTFNIVDSEGATALEENNGVLYGLYTAVSSGNIYVQFGTFLGDTGACHAVEWESAWIDLGAKNISKSGFGIYLGFDTTDTTQGITMPTFNIGIETEKKTKTKTVAGMAFKKMKRIRINNHGREFKFKLSFAAGSIPWSIATGVQIYLEYDYD